MVAAPAFAETPPKAIAPAEAAPDAQPAAPAAATKADADGKAPAAPADAKPAAPAEAKPAAAAEAKPATPTAADGKPGAKKAGEADADEADDPSLVGLKHGARSKAVDGSTVVFDKVRGVYIAPDQQHTFYVRDRFYRYVEGIWLTSASAKGPWDLSVNKSVPARLRKAYVAPNKKKVTATLPSGTVAVYEPALKVFTVPAQKDVYIHDGLYYRYMDGVWMSSTKVDGPWELAQTKKLPGPLKHRVKPPSAGQKVTLPDGTALEYDAELLLFRVAGDTGVYFAEGAFLTKREGKWMTSTRAADGFVPMNPSKVPPALKGHVKKSGGAAAAKPEKVKPATKAEREALKAEREKMRKEREAAKAERQKQGGGGPGKTRHPDAKKNDKPAAKKKPATDDTAPDAEE